MNARFVHDPDCASVTGTGATFRCTCRARQEARLAKHEHAGVQWDEFLEQKEQISEGGFRTLPAWSDDAGIVGDDD